ncbi:hypothetical protein OAC40_00450 [bacterium]|nr:hypothetical protein [bacterium]
MGRIFGCGLFLLEDLLQMPRVVTVTAQYSQTPDKVFADAIDLKELVAAMSDIAVYRGMPSEPLCQAMTIVSDVTFWGWLKIEGHHMHLENLDLVGRRLQSREHSKMVKRWDHQITVIPNQTGAIWIDQVELDAGWKTYFVALFCRYMYKHRHRRRNASQISTRIQPLLIT